MATFKYWFMIQYSSQKSITIRKASLTFICACFLVLVYAQNETDSMRGQNIYQPHKYVLQDTIMVSDSMILIRQRFIHDSIEVRLKFIQDSIAIRLKFIQDSIARRQRIHDSLVYLKKELPLIIESYVRSFSDQIILASGEIPIIGDSMLGSYNYLLLPFGLEQPFTPWRPGIALTGKSIKIKTDPATKKIVFIQVPGMYCSLGYGNNILVINEQTAVLNNRWGNYYKMPIDSVFYDRQGRVAKIKRYIQFYKATANYQKGAFLFTHLSEVKQFEYTTSNQPSKVQWISFCDRWVASDPKKVCNIATFIVTKQGSNYMVNRQNDPKNNFSDGNFTFEFENNNLKSVGFTNVSKLEDWKTIVELNEAGNVSRYIYQNKGVVNKTLLVNYYLDNPKAPNKVETVTCIFEDDGISYYQQNNTTGKVRERSRVTGEWGPWK